MLDPFLPALDQGAAIRGREVDPMEPDVILGLVAQLEQPWSWSSRRPQGV